MLGKEQNLPTFEEYLTLEEKAAYKSEYHQGQIVAMAGASLAHNRIVSNLHAALYNALQTKPCAVFASDLRLWIEQANRAVYPDIMVICGEPRLVAGRTDTVTNPQIIIEVLSKSTAEEDRSDKFQAYWSLDTFAEYALVDQYRSRVEYFRRVNEKLWELLVFTQPDDVLTLKSIKVELPLAQIYRQVQWEGDEKAN
jgi:Uma2 family endonuclease